ncbi:MAG TPA: BrnT family toxin [Patescibacteria group bacterium]
MDIIDLPEPIEFDWDEANKNKIWLKHKVSADECEEAFATQKIFSQPDELHSGKENRYILIGQTKKLRFLFIVFTLRKNKVRVISARNMHRKEVDFYEKEAGIA